MLCGSAASRSTSGLTKYVNCFGHASCGTCRLLVKKGMENLSPKGNLERFTLFRMMSAIGHEREMRLSCQCQVHGDVTVEVRPPMNLFGDVLLAEAVSEQIASEPEA